MKKLLILLIAVGFVACNSATQKTEEKATAAPAGLVQASVSIGGMTCEHCVMSVTKGLNEVEGIAEVLVTLDDSTAVIKYDAAVVDMDDIKAAVEKRGYTVKAPE